MGNEEELEAIAQHKHGRRIIDKLKPAVQKGQMPGPAFESQRPHAVL